MRTLFSTPGKKSFFIPMSLAWVLACAVFNSVYADEVDDVIRAEMTKRKIPGLQLAVVRENKIIKVASYGLASIQEKVAVDNDTIFSIN